MIVKIEDLQSKKITFTQEEKEKIRKLYLSGVPVSKLCQACGLSPNPMLRILHEMIPDFKKGMGKARLIERQNAMAVSMLESGRNLNEIAGELGVTKSAIHYRLKAAGKLPGYVPRDTRDQKRLLEVAEQWRLYRSGKSITEIAELYGVTGSCIQNRFRKAGHRMAKSNINLETKSEIQ